MLGTKYDDVGKVFMVKSFRIVDRYVQENKKGYALNLYEMCMDSYKRSFDSQNEITENIECLKILTSTWAKMYPLKAYFAKEGISEYDIGLLLRNNLKSLPVLKGAEYEYYTTWFCENMSLAYIGEETIKAHQLDGLRQTIGKMLKLAEAGALTLGYQKIDAYITLCLSNFYKTGYASLSGFYKRQEGITDNINKDGTIQLFDVDKYNGTFNIQLMDWRPLFWLLHSLLSSNFAIYTALGRVKISG